MREGGWAVLYVVIRKEGGISCDELPATVAIIFAAFAARPSCDTAVNEEGF